MRVNRPPCAQSWSQFLQVRDEFLIKQGMFPFLSWLQQHQFLRGPAVFDDYHHIPLRAYDLLFAIASSG